MKKFFLVLVLLALVAAGLWWWHRPSAAADAGDAKPVATVQVTPLVREPIARILTAYGTVEASARGTTALTLAYDCVVREVRTALGARVAAGDLLLSVDPTPDAALQLGSARSLAALAARALASTRQRYELKLATDDDLRAAEQAAEDAALKLHSLEGRGLGGAGGAITAPVAGVVAKLDFQPGAIVAAGTTLAVIAGTAGLEARLGLEPSDADKVRAGQKVTLTPISRPGQAPVVSTVGSVGGLADAATGTLDGRVPVPAAAAWYPGERVQGDIELESETGLVVPRGAVLPDDDQQVLYTLKAGKAKKHVVQVGIAAGAKLEVAAPDLAPGDPVVVQGNYELSDGMDVQIGDPNAKAEPADAAEAKP
jgi:RND family efflux transporter MFP subunit